MTVTSAGNVGIGITPTHNFNLSSAGAVEARFASTDNDCSLQISSDTDEGQDSILSFVAGTSGKGSIQYDHHATATSQKMLFKTGDDAVTAMTILGDGNIGIGNAGTAVDSLKVAKTLTAGSLQRSVINSSATVNTGTQSDNRLMGLYSEFTVSGDFELTATTSPLNGMRSQVIYSSSGDVDQVNAVEGRLYIGSNTGTILDAVMVSAVWETGSSSTITNLYGFKVSNEGGYAGTETNTYGVHIAQMHGHTLSYGVYQQPMRINFLWLVAHMPTGLLISHKMWQPILQRFGLNRVAQVEIMM